MRIVFRVFCVLFFVGVLPGCTLFQSASPSVKDFLNENFSGKEVRLSEPMYLNGNKEKDFYVAATDEPDEIKFLVYRDLISVGFGATFGYRSTYENAVIAHLADKFLAESQNATDVFSDDESVLKQLVFEIGVQIIDALPEYGIDVHDRNHNYLYFSLEAIDPETGDKHILVGDFNTMSPPGEPLIENVVGADRYIWKKDIAAFDLESYAGIAAFYVPEEYVGVQGLRYDDLPEPEVAKNELELQALADAEFGVSDKSLLE